MPESLKWEKKKSRGIVKYEMLAMAENHVLPGDVYGN